MALAGVPACQIAGTCCQRRAFVSEEVEPFMRQFSIALAVAVGLAGAASAQSVHPPTREGFGAKQDSPETRRQRTPEALGPHRPEARGGADSQMNREYGRKTEPDGKSLTDGRPQPMR